MPPDNIVSASPPRILRLPDEVLRIILLDACSTDIATFAAVYRVSKRLTSIGSSILKSSLRLPSKILTRIFHTLLDEDRHSLTVCCRVSRSFEAIASSVLYGRIDLSLLVDTAIDQRGIPGLPSLISQNTCLAIARRKKMLSNARVVDVEGHSKRVCSDNKRFIQLPKLDILVLTAHVDQYSGHLPMFHFDGVSGAQCSIIQNLSPRKLVINGACINNIEPFDRGYPTDLYNHIEQLTFVGVPVNRKPTDGHKTDFPPMPKLKKLVWMFSTPDPNTKWITAKANLSGYRHATDNDLQFYDLSRLIWRLPESQDVQVFIVNCKSVHPHIYHMERCDEQFVQESIIEAFTSSLESHRHIWQHSWSRSGKHIAGNRYEVTLDDSEESKQRTLDELEIFERKLLTVHFVSMDEYLTNHHWEGEIDPEQAKNWLSKVEEPNEKAENEEKDEGKSRRGTKRPDDDRSSSQKV